MGGKKWPSNLALASVVMSASLALARPIQYEWSDCLLAYKHNATPRRAVRYLSLPRLQFAKSSQL